MKPRLFDLCCGAGGISVGYARAGFEVVGVDIENHPSYPYPLIVGDALGVMSGSLGRSVDFDEYAVIHASPPCQLHTRAGHLRDAQGRTTRAVDLVTPLRPMLIAWAERTGGIYIIENVPGAPLLNPVQLCGSAFGLKVRRHRLFESNASLFGTDCHHERQGRPVGIYGSMRDEIPKGGRTARSIEEARDAMGIDWMKWRSDNQEWNDLKEAVPPAYSQYIGDQVMSQILAAA